MGIEELVKFLKANAGQAEDDKRHEKLLNAVIDQLPFNGVKSPPHIYREVLLPKYDSERAKEIFAGIVDVTIVSTDNKLYLIAAKVTSHSRLRAMRREMRKELQKYYGYFMEELGIPSILIGVYRIPPSSKLNSFFVPTPEMYIK